MYLTKDSTAADSAANHVADGKEFNDKIFTLEDTISKTVNGTKFIKDANNKYNAKGIDDDLNALNTALAGFDENNFADADDADNNAAYAAAKTLGYTVDMTSKATAKASIKTVTGAIAAATDVTETSVKDVNGKAISGLLDNVDTMIKSVTTERSKLGAVQNRLEYTVKVDDNTAENLQSAESRIRDTDMADEMTRFSKESILQQAATSMLAQANQSNQGVLSLLQ